MTRRRDAVVRRGLRHVGRAIAGQPAMFAGRPAGQQPLRRHDRGQRLRHRRGDPRVILPAFAAGRTTAGALALAAAAIVGVALFKILGIIGRRLFAGIMQYRLRPTCRREVTRQYLPLPLSWHRGTPPASCCPTPTPTSRARGSSSRRCRWRRRAGR